MKDYYCFDISFTNIDFDSQMINTEKSNLFHNARLYSRENEIEIQIIYESKTYFGAKMIWWVQQINWKKFGSYIKLINENQNENLEKIDLSQASLLWIKDDFFEFREGFKYVTIKIDTFKFYWLPNDEKINTAEFYLNESGFKVVEEYYSLLFFQNEKLCINRMKGKDEYYSLENTKFRPEFNFYINDDKSKSEAKIVKEPKIQFYYDENITEAQAIYYGNLICFITSFYFYTAITYVFSRINLKKNIIEIKKIQEKNSSESFGNFWGFKNYWDFHKLMNSNWQKSSLTNYNKLTIVVSRFLHAKDVYDSSKFLIYYSIIEYLKTTHKEIKPEFSFVGTKKNRSKLCKEAINQLLEMVLQSEQEEFKTKLTSFRSDLKYRLMKRPLEEFLSKSKIEIKNCSIDLNRLVEIRNSLIHGSSEVITKDELDKANKLLYRITGILILQLMGINEWELDLKLE